MLQSLLIIVTERKRTGESAWNYQTCQPPGTGKNSVMPMPKTDNFMKVKFH